MTEKELKEYLKVHFPKENNEIEWKAWTGNFNITGKRKDDLGSYVSAIANGNGGKLIIGVENITLNILGITKKKSTKEVELEILQKTYPNHEIYIEEIITNDTNKKVWIVDIKKHPVGQEVVFESIAYQRSKDSLIELTQSHKTEIRSETQPISDFSSHIITNSSFEDLDVNAILELRKKLSKSKRVDFEIPTDDIQLLKNLHLIQEDKITYAGIILLGNTLALRKYLPYAEVSYGFRLSDGDSYNQDEFIGNGGYLLYADKLWEKINNRNLRLNIPIGLGIDTTKMAFDEETVREAINNAIIHRDYKESSVIFILQYLNQLQVESPGGFPEGVNITNIADESKARNKLLADVLRWCDMVDEFGNGVNKMIKNQLRLGKNPPNYNNSTERKVILKLDGTIVDLDFAKYMIKIGDATGIELNDKELLVLHKIKNKQKFDKHLITERLLNYGFVEKVGYGKYLLSKKYYEDHGVKTKFTQEKPLKDDEIKLLIVRYLKDNKHGLTKKELLDIDSFKYIHPIKIYRMLCKMRELGFVDINGKTNSPKATWILIKEPDIKF